MNNNSNNTSYTKVFTSNTSLTKQIWEYDPLYHAEVKLFIKDILNLKHVQYKIKDKSGTISPVSVFYHGPSNRPMQFVDIVGIVRAIDIIKQRVIKYCLDDGSSTIECVTFVEDNYLSNTSVFTRVSSKFNLSELVRVIGVINQFNQTREIKIRHMDKIEDPNEELNRWTEMIYLNKNVYCKEFKVPPQAKRFLPDKPSTISSNKVFNNTSSGDHETTSRTSAQSNVIRSNVVRSKSHSQSSKSSTIKSRYNEEMLKRRIKEYIKENKLNEFRFSRIVEVPSLQQIAIKILQSQSQGREIIQVKTKGGRQEIRNLFKKILKSLIQDENYLQSDQNLILFMVVKKKKTNSSYYR